MSLHMLINKPRSNSSIYATAGDTDQCLLYTGHNTNIQ